MKIGTWVISKIDFKLKKILEKEVILGQTIYYTEDKCSYHESQLSCSTIDLRTGLIEKLKTNTEKSDELYKEIVNEAVKNSLKAIKGINYQI